MTAGGRSDIIPRQETRKEAHIDIELLTTSGLGFWNQI